MTVLFKMITPVMEVLSAYNQKLNLVRYETKTRKKLIQSGNPLRLLPTEFLALKQIFFFSGCLIGVYLIYTIDAGSLMVPIVGVFCFFLPDIKLNDLIAKRKKSIFLDLPFCMDLLTLTVEAGMSFQAGIEQVVEKGRTGPLRDEFSRLLQDIRLGVSTIDALDGLATRADMSEIRSFCSALIQAQKLGAPLANTLETQSDIRRTERFQRAEKMANEAPVKMLMPLTLFIFPAVFIIVLVPLYLQFTTGGF